jgi:hypothetical protein
MRVLIEKARVLARNLAYHRRVGMEEVLRRALEEVDRQIRSCAARGATDLEEVEGPAVGDSRLQALQVPVRQQALLAAFGGSSAAPIAAGG